MKNLNPERNNPEGRKKQLSEHDKAEQNSEKLTSYQLWRIRSKKMKIDRLKVDSWGMIVVKFFAAPLLGVLIIFMMYLTFNFDTFSILGGWMLAYFFPPLGKESVIPLGIASGLDPLLIGLAIAMIDILIALFLLWNYDFAKLIPYMGLWMEKVEKRGGKKFKEKPWLENLAFFGLIFFVMFPFQGSGGIATSIVGRVIGMNKYKVLLAIIIGALVGCLLIAYFGYLFLSFFRNNLNQGLAILIAICIILAIYNAFKYLKKDKNDN